MYVFTEEGLKWHSSLDYIKTKELRKLLSLFINTPNIAAATHKKSLSRLNIALLEVINKDQYKLNSKYFKWV